MNDTPSIPETSGKRLRIIRMMLGLPRAALCELQETVMPDVKALKPGTFEAWEAGKVDLTEEDMETLIPLIRHAGVSCSAGWLLNGSGDVPYPIKSSQPVES